MKQNAVLSLALILLFQGSPSVTATAETDNEGFLTKPVCNDARDCYIRDGELTLACYHNVKKCKCQSTMSSIYHLESIGGQCLMSKYGPCGVRGDVEVGCAGGFACIEGKCRDPKDPTQTVKGAYEFHTGSCKSCQFSDDLMLQCEGWNVGVGNEKCICRKIPVGDKRGSIWSLRNYDGDKNCSVGQFGPCGDRNGVKIDCHGVGMSCVDGTCVNPAKPQSSLNEPCESTKSCEQGLICAFTSQCIRPQSTPAGEFCLKDEECLQGLACKPDPNLMGPWNPRRCQ